MHTKKNVVTPPLSVSGEGGFDDTKSEFSDMRKLSENLRLYVNTNFVTKHNNGFLCKAQVAIFGTF